MPRREQALDTWMSDTGLQSVRGAFLLPVATWDGSPGTVTRQENRLHVTGEVRQQTQLALVRSKRADSRAARTR